MASRQPRPPSNIDVTKAYSGPSIMVGTVSDDHMLAHVELDSEGSDRLRLGALLEIAEELAARAGAAMGIERQRWIMTDISAGWIAPPAGNTLPAKVAMIARLSDHCVWQITFGMAGGATVAHATLKRHSPAVGAARAIGVMDGNVASFVNVPRARAMPATDSPRDRIAQAAAEVIATKGFAQSTVREIADAAGMHVPTLYTHIASKDDLLELVYTWSMDRILVDVDDATANCLTIRDKVRAMIKSMLARANENKRRVGVLNRELRSLPHAARERVLARYRTILSQMAGVIAEGIETGEFRKVDPMIVANIIDAACDMRALRPFIFDQVALAEFEQSLTVFIESALVHTTH
jgi:AcrR family transcriptional regulator